jgi:hypothetical protein
MIMEEIDADIGTMRDEWSKKVVPPAIGCVIGAKILFLHKSQPKRYDKLDKSYGQYPH